MGTWGLASIVAVLAGSPALATDDQTVTARDDFFTPAAVTAQVGEKVTWTHGGSNEHDLLLDGREVVPPGRGWSYERTFTAAEVGTHRFACDLHEGMSGSVVVQAAGDPAPTPTPTPTPSPAPSPSPAPAPALTIRALAPARTVFRTGRVALRIDLSAPAAVRGTLDRRGAKGFRRFGSLDFGRVAAGPRRLRFSKVRGGRRLTVGRYRLRLRVGDLNRTLTFRITRGR